MKPFEIVVIVLMWTIGITVCLFVPKYCKADDKATFYRNGIGYVVTKECAKTLPVASYKYQYGYYYGKYGYYYLPYTDYKCIEYRLDTIKVR